MGVYIKGMKMPKECEYCGFCRFYPENGNVWCNAKNIILKTKWKEPNWTHLDVKRPEWCPLVEVPELHGDLIDRDALVPDICHDWNGFCVPDDDYSAKCIANAPIVIEAERSE